MKHMKKFMALFAALALVLAMAVPAFAAVNITNHSFSAYQIFKGDIEGEVLSNVDWGANVDGEAFLAALKTADATNYGSCNSAKDVAKALADNSGLAKDFAKFAAEHVTGTPTTGTGSVNLPSAGYYLIVDTTDVSDKLDAKNLTLLKVNGAGSVTPRVKTDIPTVVKKVKDTNDTNGNVTDWQDSADYDIGDTIPYKLTATLGELTNFDHYYVEFVDTMHHLTYTGITSVKVDNTPLTSDQYSVDWDSNSKILKVSILDVKTYGATTNSKVTVEYTATLDDDAVIGSTGNPNEVYLVFSNNPNNTGNGTSKPSDTGKTPEDKNIVFTYQVEANKVNPENTALPGAAFELFKKVKNGESTDWVSKGVVNATKNADGTYTIDNATTVTKFEWKGIDDGDYKLVEVVTPQGYNTMEPKEFTVTADHVIEADNPTLTSLSGDTFTGNVNTGILSANIVNNRGTTLPSTGGIGTTIFYVVGGGLMVAAAVLLIAKKRMENK